MIKERLKKKKCIKAFRQIVIDQLEVFSTYFDFRVG